jgi:GTP-binding protein
MYSVAIIGRTNVGKSTLFNRLTRSRDALVADAPGMTRDRKVGRGQVGGAPYLVIDTGGLFEDRSELASQVRAQALQAAAEADRILFLVDARSGATPLDRELAELLRRWRDKTWLVVNKTEGLDPDSACADFHDLGCGAPIAVAAKHGLGLAELGEAICGHIGADATEVPEVTGSGTRVAVVGRPNAGKSTLVNRLLGDQRVIVGDAPGTTRDSISVSLEHHGKPYVLIDTAGIRRRARIDATPEKLSVVAALQAIDAADVVLFLIDAREGVTEQDTGLLGLVLDSGRALVIAVNKWDGLDGDSRRHTRATIERKLKFLDYVELRYISALHGSGVGKLFAPIDRAARSASLSAPTAKVTEVLQAALAAHEPPLVRGRRVKLRYAHMGGSHPPTFIVHGNRVAAVTRAYRRYLEGRFRQAFHLIGTPVRIEFRQAENPFSETGDRPRF